MNALLSLSSSPAKRTTEVVPSPTSLSYALAISTKTFAAGWTMSKRLRIVAPSLDIVVLFPILIILSMPLGPSVVLTISAIDWQALMFEIIYAFPYEVSVPSFNTKIVGCNR